MPNTYKCALCVQVPFIHASAVPIYLHGVAKPLFGTITDYRPSLSKRVGEGTVVGRGVIITSRAGAATVVVFGSLHQNQPHDLQDVVVDVTVVDVKDVSVLEVVEIVLVLSKQPAQVSY